MYYLVEHVARCEPYYLRDLGLMVPGLDSYHTDPLLHVKTAS